MNGGSSAPYLARSPCIPLLCALFNRGGNQRAFRLPGEGGDHVHCTVEPLPRNIRCRMFLGVPSLGHPEKAFRKRPAMSKFLGVSLLGFASLGSKQKGPAEQVAPRVSSLKIRRF